MIFCFSSIGHLACGWRGLTHLQDIHSGNTILGLLLLLIAHLQRKFSKEHPWKSSFCNEAAVSTVDQRRIGVVSRCRETTCRKETTHVYKKKLGRVKINGCV